MWLKKHWELIKMKKIILMCLYLLSILHGQECLETNNIKNHIVPINDNEDKVVLMRLNGEILIEIKFLNFIDREKRILYKDLNFDNKKEILINISSHEKYEEYEILTIDCDKLVSFFPKNLYTFKLNNKDKKLIEYIQNDNNYKPKYKTYCLDNSRYYLCKIEEYLIKDINKTNEFNIKNKIIKSYYSFKNRIVNLKDTIDKKNVVNLNNIAYYLQKAGSNKEAVYLLEKILKKYPTRTVAHYNLADAYWALGDKKKAVASYKTYIEQMKEKGKTKRIPKIVKERVLWKLK